MLVEGRHFDFNFSSPFEVGVKAVTQNFADIHAMGARPTGLLFAVATPPDLPLEVLVGIAEGMASEAEIVGGDVVRAQQLVLSVTALGELAGPAPALRLNRAAPGQRVVAAGPIGHSAAGLAVLQHFGSRAAVPEDDAVLQELVQWHCAPTLVVGRGPAARATGATAMTDNSDGLVRDLTAIARASGVRLELEAVQLAPDEPLLHAAEVVGADPWEWVLSGGEDHTLLATTAARVPAGFREIGVVGGKGKGEVFVDGEVASPEGGWESL